MAATFPEKEQLVSGVLVVKDFQYTIMDISDLEEFAGLQTTAVVQRQVVPYHASFGLLKYHLRQMFGKINELGHDINKRESVRVRDPLCKSVQRERVLVNVTGRLTAFLQINMLSTDGC